jgi:hypothetical protein
MEECQLIVAPDLVFPRLFDDLVELIADHVVVRICRNNPKPAG